MKIGILGGGQLGFMTILRGTYMGLEFNVLDKSFDISASKTGAKIFTFENYKQFYNESDIITFEFEHIPLEIVEYVKDKLKPSFEVFYLKQERIREKEFLKKNNFPVAKFYKADNGNQAIEIIKENNFIPCVIKTSRLGYDGKGQFYIKSFEDLKEVENLNEKLIIEEFIDFQMEISTIVARNEKDIKVFPISENFHKDGILIYNITPANISEKLKRKVEEIAIELSKAMNLIGILAIEFFVYNDDVLINEIAPRPHNTGHWTLDGCITSQFEQFLRAILNIPLGETQLIKPTLMINLIDIQKPKLEEILKIKNAYFYWYFKERKTRRKMGHINILLDNIEEYKEIINCFKIFR
jgi:5-(carboxyamino)imidazole ribonucleotide synthase